MELSFKTNNCFILQNLAYLRAKYLGKIYTFRYLSSSIEEVL